MNAKQLTTYQTVACPAEGHYREKGSRFFSFVWPVRNEEEALHYLDILRKSYPDASHICYAWVLDAAGTLFRTHDAGEPRHTAGEPILGQIKARHLTFVLVAVVRYFGGTKLGTGGLAAAYRQAAALALDKAGIVQKPVIRTVEVTCNYEVLNRVMKLAGQHHAPVRTRSFTDICTLTLEVPVAELNSLTAALTTLKAIGYGVEFKIKD